MRYEPNGIMMLTNEVFKMAEKIRYGMKAPEAKAEVKADEIEAVKAEVAKVGMPDIINAINSIAETLDAIIGKQNALKENQDAMRNRIAALEAFAYAEPSVKGRLEAIEMKLFGGIAELADAEDKPEEKEQIAGNPGKTEEIADAPSLTEDAPTKEKKKGKGILARAFGGPEK